MFVCDVTDGTYSSMQTGGLLDEIGAAVLSILQTNDGTLEDIVTFSVDKKNQLDATFCILYFSSNSCSTCYRQPCAHHQELTTV